MEFIIREDYDDEIRSDVSDDSYISDISNDEEEYEKYISDKCKSDLEIFKNIINEDQNYILDNCDEIDLTNFVFNINKRKEEGLFKYPLIKTNTLTKIIDFNSIVLPKPKLKFTQLYFKNKYFSSNTKRSLKDRLQRKKIKKEIYSKL